MAGGMGCTVLLTLCAVLVPFSVKSVILSTGGVVIGEDVGWFLAAAKKNIGVHMPVGVIAEHIDGVSGANAGTNTNADAIDANTDASAATNSRGAYAPTPE